MTRVVVIAGGSSGIGRAVAHIVAGRGDHVVLLARAEAPLLAAVAECEQAGAASASHHLLDVRDGEAVDEVFAAILAAHGRIDAVVHSSGVVAYGRFDEVPREVWDGVLRTNVLGAANVARAVLPEMRERNEGVLVLLGSVLGNIGAPGMSAYAVSKWAVRALGRQLQLDNRDRRGVHISVVSPGGVDTPIYAQAANYLGRAGSPPPPVYSPERVAAAVVKTLDRPRNRVAVGFANPIMRLGFSATPALFDLLVGPMFRMLATSGPKVPATAGNVLDPVPGREDVRG